MAALLGTALAVQFTSSNTQAAGYQWFHGATNGPVPRGFHSMVYDSVRGVVLVHGGHPGTPGVSLHKTWAWDGKTWTLLATNGPDTMACGFAFDPDRGVAVLHGGFGSTRVPGAGRPVWGNTWEWDGQNWEQVTTNTGPGIRAGCAMAYDPQHKRVLLHGGGKDLAGTIVLSDTWAWDGSSWEEITNANGPVRGQHRMVYDEKRQVMVLFGGFASIGSGPVDTWEFDGTQWHQVATNGPPGARQFPVLGYDPMREGVILCSGGQYFLVGDPKYFDDVWEWNGSAWTEITPPGTRPPALQVAAGAFDSRRGRLVLFSGATYITQPSVILSRETWEYGLPELRLTGIERQLDGMVIQWTGGAPPYQLQSCTNLNDGNWQDLGSPTDQTSATNQPVGDALFFRVVRVKAP